MKIPSQFSVKINNLVSALVCSAAGIFTKGLHAEVWDIIFWRGLFAAMFTAYTVWRGRFRMHFIGMGRSGWPAAVVGASSTAASIPAFKLTSIANVSLIKNFDMNEKNSPTNVNHTARSYSKSRKRISTGFASNSSTLPKSGLRYGCFKCLSRDSRLTKFS